MKISAIGVTTKVNVKQPNRRPVGRRGVGIVELKATNPVDRHAERLANFDRELEAQRNGGLDDMWEEVRTADQIDMARYVAELEWIIYTSVRLSDIMLNGHSEATYKRINAMYEPPATEAAPEATGGGLRGTREG